jgi:hypothetical protein
MNAFLLTNRLLRDERGQAIIEGAGAAMVMVTMLVLVVLFGQYGTAVIRAHAAARTIALDGAAPEQAWPANPHAPQVVVEEEAFGESSYPRGLQSRWDGVGLDEQGGAISRAIEGLLVGECRVTIEDVITGIGPVEGGGFRATTIGFRASYTAARHPWRFDGRMTLDSLNGIYSKLLFSAVQENNTIANASGCFVPPMPHWGLERHLFGGLRF